MDELGFCMGQGLINLGGINNDVFQPVLTLSALVSISEVESPNTSIEEKNSFVGLGVDIDKGKQPSTAGGSAGRSCTLHEVDLSSGGLRRGVARFHMRVSQSVCNQAVSNPSKP